MWHDQQMSLTGALCVLSKCWVHDNPRLIYYLVSNTWLMITFPWSGQYRSLGSGRSIEVRWPHHLVSEKNPTGIYSFGPISQPDLQCQDDTEQAHCVLRFLSLWGSRRGSPSLGLWRHSWLSLCKMIMPRVPGTKQGNVSSLHGSLTLHDN